MSHWNFDLERPLANQIDFQSMIAGGVRAVWLKCTEGLSYVDPVFEFLTMGLDANRIPFGHYHVLDPVYDGAEQYKVFSDELFMRGDLQPWLDVELVHGMSNASITRETIAWLEEAVKEWDRPFLYSNFDFLNNRLLDPVAIAEMADIVMAYPVPSLSQIPASRWPRGYAPDAIKIWQKDWYARIPGIMDQTVDGSVPLDQAWFERMLKDATGAPIIYEVEIIVPKGVDIIKPTFILEE
jgi:GH25 family lysozyme M1 (1,4-beta-N-acetylmuramidase)